MKRQTGKAQNAEINILKFVFAWAVVFYHYTLNYNFGLTYAGYIAVDYFFLLSGIFLHRKEVRSGWKVNPFSYTWKRFLQFLPYVLYTFVIEVIIRAAHSGTLSAGILLQWIYAARWELLSLTGFGLRPEWDFYPPLWFVSSLLIGGLVVTMVGRALGKRADWLVLPAAAAIYAYFLVTLGHIRAEGDYQFLFTMGTWRAIAGLCAGAVADRMAAWLHGFLYRDNAKDPNHTPGRTEDFIGSQRTGKAGSGRVRAAETKAEYGRIRTAETLLHLAAWVLVVYALYCHRLYPTTRLDFWFIAVMTLAFVLILGTEEPVRLQEWRLPAFLGKLSMVIYFNHNYLMELFFWNAIGNPLVRAAGISCAVLAASFLCMGVIGGGKQIIHRLRAAVK